MISNNFLNNASKFKDSSKDMTNQQERKCRNKTIKQGLVNRCLLRLEYQLQHPILCTTLATDKKLPLSHLHISYQNLKISLQKMGLILVNKCFELN